MVGAFSSSSPDDDDGDGEESTISDIFPSWVVLAAWHWESSDSSDFRVSFFSWNSAERRAASSWIWSTRENNFSKSALLEVVACAVPKEAARQSEARVQNFMDDGGGCGACTGLL